MAKKTLGSTRTGSAIRLPLVGSKVFDMFEIRKKKKKKQKKKCELLSHQLNVRLCATIKKASKRQVIRAKFFTVFFLLNVYYKKDYFLDDFLVSIIWAD